MKKLAFILMIFIVAPVLMVQAATSMEKSAFKQLKKALKTDAIEMVLLGKLDNISSYYTINENNDLKGYLILSKSTGLYEKFDIMVYTNTGCETELVRILRYPTTYGMQVTSTKWLSQFIGNKGNSLKYGLDVQAISGATKSASHLTRDIPKVVRLLKEKLEVQ